MRVSGFIRPLHLKNGATYSMVFSLGPPGKVSSIKVLLTVPVAMCVMSFQPSAMLLSFLVADWML
jgi:hypothetical protein